MGEANEIRCYEYVNHPFPRVRDALVHGALVVFQAATGKASTRAESVASELRVDLGKIRVGADIEIHIQQVSDRDRQGWAPARTQLDLAWQAAGSPRWFPVMKATLSIYPLTDRETQLDLIGHYAPPFGVLGKALNALVGHRIAEACVHRFLRDVAEHLREVLRERAAH
jgi:hypothetical protein